MHTQQSQESNPQPQKCGNVLIKHKCTYSSILMQTATTLVMKVLFSPATYIDLELFLWQLSTSGVYWQSLSECDRVLLWMLTCCRSNSVSVIFCCWRSVISAKAPAALDLKYKNGHWHCFLIQLSEPRPFQTPVFSVQVIVRENGLVSCQQTQVNCVSIKANHFRKHVKLDGLHSINSLNNYSLNKIA